MDLFTIKYFMVLVIIFELMMSYFLISAVYMEYKKKRVTINKVILIAAFMITIILITFAIIVFAL